MKDKISACSVCKGKCWKLSEGAPRRISNYCCPSTPLRWVI